MSTYIDATAGAVEHCEAMAALYPDLAEPYYNKIATQCKEKLWHQLTLTLLEFVGASSTPTPSTSQEKAVNTARTTAEGVHTYLAIYDKVVSCVDSKLNPLSLSRIASAVATALSVTDMTAAKAVLENLLANKKDSLGTTATIYVQSKLSLLTLGTIMKQKQAAVDETMAAQHEQQLQQIKQTCKRNAAVLAEMMVDADNVDQAIVHAAHYEQAMTYHKVVGPPEAFYEQAVSFLNYAPPPDKIVGAAAATSAPAPAAGTVDYHQLAVDLCLAALTGDGVYNLGQIEQTPILTQLHDSAESWLVELLQAVAAGNVLQFRALTEKYATQIAQQPALVNRSTAVQEKLTLLALVHLVFEKDSHERCLAFDEIATRLHVPIDQVEWVLMRAFSVNLMEGWMDQVEQHVQVTAVMPRVLNAAQMKELATKFGEWAGKVAKTKDFMEEQTVTTFA